MRRASGTRKTASTRIGASFHTATMMVKLATRLAATRADTCPPASAIAIADTVAQTAPSVWAKASFRNSIARLNRAMGTTLSAPMKNERARNCRMVATRGS